MKADAALFDLSTPELVRESAANFVEIYGKAAARDFIRALQLLV